MASTTFSGPVTSTNGFIGTATLPTGLTADLPAAAAANLGQLRIITDNGAGNDEFAVVVSNGTAWVAIDTAALS
jgi:hypothetical protein